MQLKLVRYLLVGRVQGSTKHIFTITQENVGHVLRNENTLVRREISEKNWPTYLLNPGLSRCVSLGIHCFV